MEAHKAQFALSRELVQEIDALVGPDGRSAFLEEAAQAEVRRRQLLAFLRNPEPAWKDESHPELAEGTEPWVRSLRGEWTDRSLLAPASHDD